MEHSKTSINAAGRTIRAYLDAAALGGADEELFKQSVAAVEVVDWWRAEHQSPLTRVAAGLRYYVREQQAGERIFIGQRLKRFPRGRL